MNRYLAAVVLSLLALGAAASSSSDVERVETLEREVQQLNARVRELESIVESLLQQGAQKTPNESSAPLIGPIKASPERPRVLLGGRVKADLLFNDPASGLPGGAGRIDTAFVPGLIPLNKAGETGELSASARDSRLWINALSDTPNGELSAYLELDFVSADNSGNERVTNSYNPRLRHAYASYRGLTVGQTSSTFFNSSAFPEINDANGPVGILNVRQPLARYTWPSNQNHQWTLAIEQPETVLSDTTGASVAIGDDRLPDLVGRVDVNAGQSLWSVSAMLRQLRIDELTPGLGRDEVTGWGVSAAGRIYLQGADNFRFTLTHGRGIGRYVSYNAFDDGELYGDGTLRATPVTAGYIAYQHWWRPSLRTNWVMGMARADPDRPVGTSSVNESYRSMHLNLLWSPIPQATLGLEWLFGERRLTDGIEGQLNRVQLSTLYKFRSSR